MVNTVTPILGVDFDNRSLTNDTGVELGTLVNGNDGKEYVRVLATEAIAIGTCTVDLSTFAVTDAAGNFTADVAFLSGEYGWVKRTAFA